MGKPFWLLVFCYIFLLPGLLWSESIDSLQANALELLKINKLGEALKLHEMVVSIDSNNLESNTWIGNYYFLLGKELVNVSEKKFREIQEPTRMQSAFFMDELKVIYIDYFLKAEPYLKKSLELRNNDYIKQLLESINLFSLMAGIQPVQDKKGKKKTSKY